MSDSWYEAVYAAGNFIFANFLSPRVSKLTSMINLSVCKESIVYTAL